MRKEKRYTVNTAPGVSFGVEAVDEEAARHKVLGRGVDEVLEVVAEEPAYWMYEADGKWEDELYMNYGEWIQSEIDAVGLVEWIAAWSDWQLRFIIEDEIGYTPGDGYITLNSAKDDYIKTKLGMESPPGIGELTFLHVEPRDGGRMYVSASFENTWCEHVEE